MLSISMLSGCLIAWEKYEGYSAHRCKKRPGSLQLGPKPMSRERKTNKIIIKKLEQGACERTTTHVFLNRLINDFSNTL